MRSVQAPVSSIAPSPAVPAVTPVVCAFYPSGRCNRGNACRYSHALPALSVYQQPPHVPSRPRPPQHAPSSVQQSGTNVPKVGIPTVAVPKRPCYRFADGHDCDAATCCFDHRELTAEEARARALSRDESNRGICLQFQSRGSCCFGQECGYRHGDGASVASSPRASAPSATPKAGAANRSPSRRGGKGKGRSSSRPPAKPAP